MQIELTPEQDDVVRHAIASGRIARPEEAVAQAMTDWVERERQRAELIASLDEAEAEHERGESIRIDTMRTQKPSSKTSRPSIAPRCPAKADALCLVAASSTRHRLLGRRPCA